MKRPRPSASDVNRARGLRDRCTEAERRLWARLRDRRLCGLKFRRQEAIGPYIADFVCRELMLIIELDGGQHSERSAYDARRSAYLERFGFRVIRFWNEEVFKNWDGIARSIDEELEALRLRQRLLRSPLGESTRGRSPSGEGRR